MNADSKNKNLDELISRAIGRDKPQFDFDKWQINHKNEIDIFETQTTEREKSPVRIFKTGRIIMKSPITKIATAAAIIIIAAIGIKYYGGFLHTTSTAYGITDLPSLLKEARTLHVKSTIYSYETDLQQPEFDKAKVIPHELWLDVPNMREHFISYMSWSTPDGKMGLNLIEGVRDREYAMDIDHTEKTVRFNKVSLVERRLQNKDAIQRYLNKITEEELHYFEWVGQETINGILYDIWERESEEIHDPQTYKRVRCWMSPSTGDIGRIYIWRKNNENDWRLSWSVETIERDIEIPDSIFEFNAPEDYKYYNTLETAYDSGLGEGIYFIGGVRFGMPINFTLDDGSVIVSWHCVGTQTRVFQDQEHLFKDLVPGDHLPQLPMVIYGLKTIPRETYSHPVILFTGRHLAYTKKGNWNVEWAIFVPEEPLPVTNEGQGYRMLCEFNLENEQPPQEGNPLSENRIDADEFDLLVRAAMAELSDDGMAPEQVTYQNVMELTQQIRKSLNQ